MYNGLGFSVYLSTFPRQRDALAGWARTGAPVFLSLHISEEFGPGYCQQAEAVCQWLFEAGFSILADVSVKTRQQFGEPDSGVSSADRRTLLNEKRYINLAEK